MFTVSYKILKIPQLHVQERPEKPWGQRLRKDSIRCRIFLFEIEENLVDLHFAYKFLTILFKINLSDDMLSFNTISVSSQLLDILEEFVISKGMVYSRLDGSTKAADRTRLVREFNLDPSISLCLVSTKAGGLGLNFTGANVVIIFDPNWNPSSDLQAQDRLVKGTNTHGLLTLSLRSWPA